jgi:hypothetical protein
MRAIISIGEEPLRYSVKLQRGKTKSPIHSAEIETGLIRFCDLINGYLYLANQVSETGFDCAKSVTA